jgi:hypothetical protein
MTRPMLAVCSFAVSAAFMALACLCLLLSGCTVTTYQPRLYPCGCSRTVTRGHPARGHANHRHRGAVRWKWGRP